MVPRMSVGFPRRVAQWVVTLLVLLVQLQCQFTAADLVISEFLASNTVAGLLDQDGEPSDWLEIHNTDLGAAFNLAGLSLTDNILLPNQWTFPAGVTIPANGYLVVFCSSKNLVVAGLQLHTNFKLGAGGEYLALSNGSTVLSAYAPLYPVQTPDRSYGIDRTGNVGYFSIPTPGAANGVGDTVQVAARATASVDRGFYTNPFSVTLTTVEPAVGAQIRYTLNGSEPTASNGGSFVYTAPIAVSTTTILRAATFLTGVGTVLPSPTSTYSYIFIDQVIRQPASIPGFPNGIPRAVGNAPDVPLDMAMDPQIVNAYAGEIGTAMTAIPTLSLTASLDHIFGSSTGFYLTEDLERKVSIEILHRTPTTGQMNQQIDVGAESHSHNRLKRSIRLNFRTDYGPREWETTLFRDFPINGGTATNKVRTVVLRGGNNRCKREKKIHTHLFVPLSPSSAPRSNAASFYFSSFRLGPFVEPGRHYLHGR
jgi:Chitobiase/beta-hexosaminidase C-terminal domain/Lamin Tail Domain